MTPSHSGSRWRRVLPILISLLMIVSLLQGMAMLRSGAVHGNDFKHEWAGAWLLMHGLSPYDPPNLFRIAGSQQWNSINPFVYLPTTGLLLRPLAGMAYAPAALLWFILNWLLAWAIVLAGPSALRVARPDFARLAGAAFLAGSFPFYRQMSSGQMNVVTAGLILLAAAALLRRRESWAGVALGIGFAWKIAPAVLIGALLPLRRWRAFAVGCGVSAVLLIASIGVYGWPIHRQSLDVIRQMSYGHSTWSEFQNDFYRDPYNQSPNALMHHLFTRNPYTQPWLMLGDKAANGLTMLATAVIAGAWGVAFLKTWRRRRMDAQREGAPDLALFLAATLLMLLLPSLCWDHYAVQALPALIWIFGDARTTKSRWRASCAVAILILLSIPWFHAAPAFRTGTGILLMSLRLWPLLALYAWLLLDAIHFNPSRLEYAKNNSTSLNSNPHV